MSRNAAGSVSDLSHIRPRNPRSCVWLVLLALLGGCATQVIAPQRPDTVIVLPGIGGDGAAYSQVTRSLHDYGSDDCLRVFGWGYSWPLFWFSMSSSTLHDYTELQLADQIIAWRRAHPHSRIVLIAHSAGAGVVVGALSRLPDPIEVGPVILLAPALSPDFDLRPALKHANIVHVFYNPRDEFWQGWGPTIFGNYDGVHSDGAGRFGFTLTNLGPPEKARVFQHPYQSQWNDLGNHGGHFDWLAEPFVGVVLKPLIDPPFRQDDTIAAGKARSSAANWH